MANPVEAALAEVRAACLALPEVTERLSHGSPTFFVRGKKTFVMFLNDHHGDGRLALWVAAAPGVQAEMVDEEPRPQAQLEGDRRDLRRRLPPGGAEDAGRPARRRLISRRRGTPP
jgi:hypothetical protein